MESSHNVETESMSRKRRAQVANVRLVVGFLANRFNTEPFPAMSEHFDQHVDPDFFGDYHQIELPFGDEGGRWDDQGRYFAPDEL
jgi:hypothetical protein